jgi:hypothetical protein
VALIVFALPLSCDAVGLAGEASAKDINSSSVICRWEGRDIFVQFRIWEVMGKDTLPERVHFAVKDVLPSHPLGGQIEAAYAAK